ncbi:hypothetical protein ACA910_016371 [Epithemia clementina (nom. ined.)]
MTSCILVLVAVIGISIVVPKVVSDQIAGSVCFACFTARIPRSLFHRHSNDVRLMANPTSSRPSCWLLRSSNSLLLSGFTGNNNNKRRRVACHPSLAMIAREPSPSLVSDAPEQESENKNDNQETERAADFLAKVDDLLEACLKTKSNTTWSSVAQHIHRRTRERHLADFENSDSAIHYFFTIKEELNNENPSTDKASGASFEWINVSDEGNESYYPIALQSLQPILNQSSIQIIRRRAEEQWNINQSQNAANSNKNDLPTPTPTTTSRFTYQRPGNYEAHIADLGPQVVAIVNELLRKHVYPTIQGEFSDLLFVSPLPPSNESPRSSNPQQRQEQQSCVFVYDALYIRYNATEASLLQSSSLEQDTARRPYAGDTAQRRRGAGQPLHRDLSLVSVNVMLNDAAEFEGGGTFFENQLRCHHDTSPPTPASSSAAQQEPIKPLGMGHCLIHSSAERHAGANTWKGVRDVMVIFVSACSVQQQHRQEDGVRMPLQNDIDKTRASTIFHGKTMDPPGYIQNALLKQCMDECQLSWWLDKVNDHSFLCSLCHNRLAIDAVPDDGEAYQYLGNALVACADQIFYQNQEVFIESKRENSVDILELACQSYRQALLYAPCDGRVYNNLGLALTKLRDRRRMGHREMLQPDHNIHNDNNSIDLDSSIETTYQNGLRVLEGAFHAGCDVDKDRNALRLNYGLFVANQDRFQQAATILSPLVTEEGLGGIDKNGDIVLRNAKTLHDFCLSQIHTV